MNQKRPRSFVPVVFFLTTGLLAVDFGCAINNQLMPLEGEDPNALEFAGERVAMLGKSGAIVAVEALMASLRAKDAEASLDLLGPSSIEVLLSEAENAKISPAELLLSGRVKGFDVSGSADPIAALSANGDVRIEETELPRLSSRKVVVKILKDGGKELSLPVVFTSAGWRVELVSASANAG